MNHPTVRYISDCFIKPKHILEESKQPVYLSPWDLAMPCVNYIQKGLLFHKPPSFDTDRNQFPQLLNNLKEPLSLTLVHFYTLSGRLSTLKREDPHLYTFFIDCVNSPGARFVQASVDLTISDILSPTDVPVIVQSFFDHDRAINHDGHTMSLLTIQVTDLIDGIFIGCSFNHMAGDGTSFWHFFNTWSKIFQANGENITISNPPIHKHYFPEGHGPILSLPYTHHDQFIFRHEAPPLRERFFHFGPDALAKLKERANNECNTTKISSLQAVSALVWRCVTKHRKFPPEQEVTCRLAMNNRTRLNPPLPSNYFGNCIQAMPCITTAGELLEHGLGWAALLLHHQVMKQTGRIVQDAVESWLKSPSVFRLDRLFDPSTSIMMGSSPRFNMYGNEFGLGKAIALRSGYANKFVGKISLYEGFEGGNSMDLEVCLSPELMCALESDKEFIEFASPQGFNFDV